MVVIACVYPIHEIRLLLVQPCRCVSRVLIRIRPRIEVKIVVQFAVDPGQRYTAVLRPEATMIDVRRPPEITARRQLTELHHRAIAVNVIRLFRAIVVGNVVLDKFRHGGV